MTQFGDFLGEEQIVTEEQYVKIIELSKTFYLSGFEMVLEDGKSFIVFPPEITSKSILKISIIDV